MWVISDQELCSVDIREFLGKYHSKRDKASRWRNFNQSSGSAPSNNYGMSASDPL